ncbi:MAG: SDR family oxidoreductase [Myxococcota bacterium]
MTTLITGATGTIGSKVAQRLITEGERVRVASRDLRRLDGLVARGAEAVPLDLEDPASREAAFAGVERLFLVGPQASADFGDRVAEVVATARDAGVKLIVRLSAVGAHPEAGFVLAREHGRAEQALAASGVPWVSLQPTFFQDNLLTYQRDAIRGQGAFYGASSGGRVAYVSGDDIAEVAARILREPASHVGRTYVLTGPEALLDTEVAELVSTVLDRPVRFVDVGLDAYRANLAQAGSPEWMVESMAALETIKAQGFASEISPIVEQLLGRPATPFSRFLEAHAADFRGDSAAE